jgi:hypothetical protein
MQEIPNLVTILEMIKKHKEPLYFIEMNQIESLRNS